MKLFETHKKSRLNAFAKDVIKILSRNNKLLRIVLYFLIAAITLAALIIYIPKISYYFLPIETLTIDIKHIDYQKLAYKRKIALEKDYLFRENDDYVPAKIRFKNNTMVARLRLKGDLISHLGHNKWSFRVKIKGDHSLWGMKQFSLQHPEERNYLTQWIFHKFLKREALIGLRYKFINVIINGKNWGLYALEEHFDKYLIENNKRREGPILKLNEDIFWKDRYQNDFSHQTDLQDHNALNVEPFKKNSILANPSLNKSFIAGYNLLEAFRNKELMTHEVFDIKKLAKYFALSDLLGAAHATRWHNIRFYYNPVASRLEPIGYDAGGDEIDYILGSLRGAYFVPDAFNEFLSLFFEDNIFFAEYIKQLEQVSEADYLDRFLKEIDLDLRKNQNILEQTFKKYKFNKTLHVQQPGKNKKYSISY